ncbi:MAG: cell division protein ZapB [Deltaproteobacteria bacterium]|jgi:chromosome segregation ATPase|nr:cell division protein ZapB [Deltaproteobacteria bacterium]
MDFSKFDLLESRLGSLLERLKALESDNQSLKDQLATAQNGLETAQKQIADLTKARDSVVYRIDSLLDRLAQAGLAN